MKRPKPVFDDEEARQRIRTSLDESLIVEAAAGTGKTSELIHRIVAVLKRGANVERIVAVTFTRKAAGELKLRLRQELDRALGEARTGSASLEADVRNLEHALEHLEEAHIGTIHSFCADILRERPVEANIDPAFTGLEDSQAKRVYREAFKQWAHKKLEEMPPGLRRVLSRLAVRQSEQSPLAALEEAGWKLIEWRDFPREWRREPFEREKSADELVKRAFDLADTSERCPKPKDYLFLDLAPARAFTSRLRRAEELSSGRDYDTLEALLVKLGADLKRKPRKGTGTFAEGVKREDVLRAREDLLTDLHAFKQHADADLAAILQADMRDLLDRYDQLKRVAGGLDFTDLLLKVRDLVKQNAEIRRYLQRRFTHIFVDEFQDTDPLQVEILLLLAADNADEKEWEKAKPSPGKLFLVGDPKQSIYRFRRADVLLYQRVRESLTSKGVALLHLTKSYRALPALQQCINAAFAPEMTGDDLVGQPAYVPLEKYRETRDDQPAVIALPAPSPFSDYGRVRYEKINECMPDAVGAFIAWLINESGWTLGDAESGENPKPRKAIRPRDICILFRRFVSWGDDVTAKYLRALEARDVPHLLVGAKSFHSREEVETLRTALTAIEWPDDELSVFATLKGSLFALPDSVLLRFKLEQKAFHPFRPLPAELDADLQPVADALRLLAEFHRRRNRRPVVETIHDLLEKTRAHAGFALRPAGNQILANVYRVADLARAFELSGGISFRGFVEELAAQAEREEGSDSPVFEEAAEGVRIMTVHGAKGLEFPVVILADITAKLSRTPPEKYIDGQQELAAISLAGFSPWDLLDHQLEEEARDQAEGVRVAYVAATRARDLLVVGTVGAEPTEGWWLSPLNRAIYPEAKARRRPRPAPACPKFGAATALEAYANDQLLDQVVMPGLHHAAVGDHSVVWWDPDKLKLEVEANFGLRQQEILAEDVGHEAVDEGVRRYAEWKTRRAQAVEAGQRAEFDVFTVTSALDAPADFEASIQVEMTEKAPNCPQGPRFGSLVHAILRDAALDGDAQQIARLAKVHGRVFGAPAEEIDAAATAVANALAHPLVRRARSASRLYRELPIIANTADGRIVEGTIDLAFQENGVWNIVDFKTDPDVAILQAHYRRQLQWYLFALARITGRAARGWLLSV
ncbi:MAG: UvrD-helicase domain-containing protein [Terriglobia bacterium]